MHSEHAYGGLMISWRSD